VKEHPTRWEPLEALGELAWRKGELENARNWLRKAVDLQPDNWNAYWDYARLAHAIDSEQPAVIAALRRMLALNQAHLDAKLMLAEELFRGKHYGESLVAYNEITSIDAVRAPRLFLGKAYALLRMKDFARGRTAAEQALKYAKEATDRESAQSILTFLDRRAEFEKQGIQVAQAPSTPAEQGFGLSDPLDDKPVLPSVRGVLLQVECKGETARLLLQAGQRQIGFLINDPNRVLIRNAPGTAMNLTCGKQPPGTLVLIEFEEKSDRTLGTFGEVRVLEFLK
jgi:tetratricopeptide (TPR) repeat protein